MGCAIYLMYSRKPRMDIFAFDGQFAFAEIIYISFDPHDQPPSRLSESHRTLPERLPLPSDVEINRLRLKNGWREVGVLIYLIWGGPQRELWWRSRSKFSSCCSRISCCSRPPRAKNRCPIQLNVCHFLY